MTTRTQRTKSLWGSISEAPEATKDPEGWNAYWENHVKDDNANKASLEFTIQQFGSHLELIVGFIRFGIRRLVDYQRAITEFYNPETFDATWKALTNAERRKHMLEGLVRSAIVDPDSESYRSYCSDLTLEVMGKNKGELFLKVVKMYVCPDLSKLTPETTASYPHPKWTKDMRREREKDKNSPRAQLWESVQLNRDLFYCRFIAGTFESVACKPRPSPPVMVKPNVTNRSELHKDVVDQIKRFGGDDANTKKFLHQVNERWKEEMSVTARVGNRRAAPQTMSEVPEQSSTTGILLLCSLFRECQKQDWPVHKTFCGKPHSADSAKSISTPDFVEPALPINQRSPSRFGPPKGFTRSPALERQISYLNDPTNAQVDYILFSRSGKPHPVILPDDGSDDLIEATVKWAFERARYSALVLNEKLYIIRIAQHLIRRGWTGAKDLKEQDIQDQFQAEFPSISFPVYLESLEKMFPGDKTVIELEGRKLLQEFEAVAGGKQ
ncbi:hypothetical protein BDQ17DRAFT_1329984 [Cyathus striatus]|nr:hypothetical protein BDQ17DRAFT_1329984 [Cyathus striatus]